MSTGRTLQWMVGGKFSQGSSRKKKKKKKQTCISNLGSLPFPCSQTLVLYPSPALSPPHSTLTSQAPTPDSEPSRRPKLPPVPQFLAAGLLPYPGSKTPFLSQSPSQSPPPLLRDSTPKSRKRHGEGLFISYFYFYLGFFFKKTFHFVSGYSQLTTLL